MADTIKLAITGMTCDHCVRAVTTALEDVDGVESAEVRLEDNAATVVGAKIDVRKLLAAVEEEGYEAAVTA